MTKWLLPIRPPLAMVVLIVVATAGFGIDIRRDAENGYLPKVCVAPSYRLTFQVSFHAGRPHAVEILKLVEGRQPVLKKRIESSPGPITRVGGVIRSTGGVVGRIHGGDGSYDHADDGFEACYLVSGKYNASTNPDHPVWALSVWEIRDEEGAVVFDDTRHNPNWMKARVTFVLQAPDPPPPCQCPERASGKG